MKKSVAVIFALGGFWLGMPATSAQTPPLHVLASNAVKEAIEALKPKAEKAVGRAIEIEYGSSAGLKRKAEGGEAFDLAILTPEATVDLVKSGKIAAGTPTELARTGLGFGIRAGSPKPEIGTPEAVKRTLLKAKSISIAKEGGARAAIDKMFARLGITEALASKMRFEAGTDEAGESVAEGKADLEIVLLSEVTLVKGVVAVGPVPSEFQSYLRFQVSVGANAKDANAAKLAITYLTSPAAAPIFKGKGMETK